MHQDNLAWSVDNWEEVVTDFSINVFWIFVILRYSFLLSVTLFVYVDYIFYKDIHVSRSLHGRISITRLAKNPLITTNLVSVRFGVRTEQEGQIRSYKHLPVQCTGAEATSCLIWRYVPINNSRISTDWAVLPYPLPPQMVIVLRS